MGDARPKDGTKACQQPARAIAATTNVRWSKVERVAECTQGGPSQSSRRRKRARQPHFLHFHRDCYANAELVFATRSIHNSPPSLTSGRARAACRVTASARDVSERRLWRERVKASRGGGAAGCVSAVVWAVGVYRRTKGRIVTDLSAPAEKSCVCGSG